VLSLVALSLPSLVSQQTNARQQQQHNNKRNATQAQLEDGDQAEASYSSTDEETQPTIHQ
jgi:hypothetical protein